MIIKFIMSSSTILFRVLRVEYKHITPPLLCAGLVKLCQKLPIRNPKPDVHNINAHTEFGENPLIFNQVIVWRPKSGRTEDGQTQGRLT